MTLDPINNPLDQLYLECIPQRPRPPGLSLPSHSRTFGRDVYTDDPIEARNLRRRDVLIVNDVPVRINYVETVTDPGTLPSIRFYLSDGTDLLVGPYDRLTTRTFTADTQETAG